MNKKNLICLLMAGTILAGVSMTGAPIKVYAEPNNATEETQKPGDDNATIPENPGEPGEKPEPTPPLEGGETTPPTEGADTTAPVIEVAKAKFLVEQGSKFDFKKELALKVTDDVDGDLTSKLEIPEIVTDNTKELTFTAKARDVAGNVATKPIVINIIGFLEGKSVEKPEDIKTADLMSLVNGKKDDLKVTLKNVDETKSTFTIEVTDGTNTIAKTLNLLDKDGKPFPAKPGTTSPNTDKKPTTGPADKLPATGVIPVSVGGVLVAVGAGTTYFVRKRIKK